MVKPFNLNDPLGIEELNIYLSNPRYNVSEVKKGEGSYKANKLAFMRDTNRAKAFFEGTLDPNEANQVFLHLMEYAQNPPIIGRTATQQPIYGDPIFPYPYNQLIKKGNLTDIQEFMMKKYPTDIDITPSMDSSVLTDQEDKTIVKPDDESVKSGSMEEALDQPIPENILMDTLKENFKGVYEGDVDLTTGSGIGDLTTAIKDELVKLAKESKTLGKKFNLSERPNVQTVLSGMFRIAKLILRDDIGGRPLAADAEQLDKLFKEPGVFIYDSTFYEQLKEQQLNIAFGAENAKQVFDNPNTSVEDKKQAQKRLEQLKNLYNMYIPFIKAYEGVVEGPGGDELFSKDAEDLEKIPPGDYGLGTEKEIVPLQ